ncbi:MAG: hypothetical protein Q9176_001668 [Flavoplaca citrina]
MNDPGLDEPIQETSKDVEQDRKDELDFHKEDEQAFLTPSRWWFASTAFPLLAGTFGPMASAFSVCALSENWRVIVPDGPGGNEAHGFNVKDPAWQVPQIQKEHLEVLCRAVEGYLRSRLVAEY